MKKLLLVGIISMIALTGFGQHGKKDPIKSAERQTEKMKTHLELTESQYASVKKINTTYAEKIVALKDEEKKNAEQFKTLRQQKKTEIYSVLTPAQQEKWNEFKKEKKQRKHGKGKHFHHGKHGKGRD